MPFDVGGNIWNGAMAKVQNSRSIITRGLVLHLDAGVPGSYPGSGTTWYDLSGNGNDGTLTNGPTFSSDKGGCIVFDGSNDYVAVSDATSLQFGSGDFTISIWFFNIQDSTYNCLYGDYNAGDIWIQITDAASFRVGFRDSSGNENDYSSSYSVTDNVIYNVVFIRDNNNNHLYVNGSLINTQTVTGVGSTDSGATKIIGALASYANWHKGNIYCVQVYKGRSLSSSEVNHNFNAQRDRFGV